VKSFLESREQKFLKRKKSFKFLEIAQCSIIHNDISLIVFISNRGVMSLDITCDQVAMPGGVRTFPEDWFAMSH